MRFTSLKNQYIIAALGLFLFQRVAEAQGNLVVNGTFTGSASNWTIVNNPGFTGYSAVGGNPGGCVGLDNVAPSPSSDPTASQTVSALVPGVPYVVSGQYQQGKDRGGGVATDPSFGVAIDGTFLFQAVAPNNQNWQSFVFGYTATSNSVDLSVSSQIGGTGISYFIDNIALQPFPSLNARMVGANVALEWPTNVFGFALQSSTNFPGASGWSNVPNAVVVSGTNYTVTLNATRPQQFFRLKL